MGCLLLALSVLVVTWIVRFVAHVVYVVVCTACLGVLPIVGCGFVWYLLVWVCYCGFVIWVGLFSVVFGCLV